MAELPLACNVQGDYGYKIIMVEEDDTISQVTDKALAGVVGYLIAPFPEGTAFQVRVHGAEKALSNTATVKDSNLLKMEALDISVET